MSNSLDFNIRERLAAYLAGEISLREFEDWFFPETWNVDQLDNLALANLVYGIKIRLAEFSNGDWTEKELKSLLHPFIEKYEIVSSSVQVKYGTSNTNFQASTSVSVHLIYKGR